MNVGERSGGKSLDHLADLAGLAALHDPSRDPLAWAEAEAELCDALVREGIAEGRIDWLVEAAIRATDAISARPLPAELRSRLLGSAHEALRTLARTDGRLRRRLRFGA